MSKVIGPTHDTNVSLKFLKNVDPEKLRTRLINNQVEKEIPTELARFIRFLADDELDKGEIDSLDEDSQLSIENCRTLIYSDFEYLLKDREIRSSIENFAISSLESNESFNRFRRRRSSLFSEFVSPETITHDCVMVGDEPAIDVYARVGVFDSNDDLIAKLTVGLGDLIFCASSFVNTATGLGRSAFSQIKRGNTTIDNEDLDDILDSIDSVRNNLNEAEQVIKSLKLEDEASSKK